MDIVSTSAHDLARAIRDGEVTSVEVTRAFVERSRALHPKLNAVVVERFEAAIEEAKAIDEARAKRAPLGPLAGVPISIKECFDLEGTPSTLGLTHRAHWRARADAPVVAKLRAAGAIVLGKTNVPQLLMYSEADNALYGRTANPWALDRSAGGSSGGEGAVLAARCAPLGLGTDIGGSVRIPAHFCGIASFKPTPRTMPMAGTGEIFSGMQDDVPDMVGPMARSVDDLALAMTVLRGDAPLVPVEPRTLRVGFYESAGDIESAPAIRRAIREVAALLERHGAHVVPFPLDDAEELMGLLGGFLFQDLGRAFAECARGSRIDPRNLGLASLRFLPISLQDRGARILENRGFKALARTLATPVSRGPRRVNENRRRRDAIREALFAAMDRAGVDLLLGPVHPTVAVRAGATKRMTPLAACTAWCNVLELPAGAIPVTRVRPGEESDRPPSRDPVVRAIIESEQDSVGLPVCVHLAGRPHDDARVLAAMRAIETLLADRDDVPRYAPL